MAWRLETKYNAILRAILIILQCFMCCKSYYFCNTQNRLLINIFNVYDLIVHENSFLFGCFSAPFAFGNVLSSGQYMKLLKYWKGIHCAEWRCNMNLSSLLRSKRLGIKCRQFWAGIDQSIFNNTSRSLTFKPQGVFFVCLTFLFTCGTLGGDLLTKTSERGFEAFDYSGGKPSLNDGPNRCL